MFIFVIKVHANHSSVIHSIGIKLQVNRAHLTGLVFTGERDMDITALVYGAAVIELHVIGGIASVKLLQLV